ncbi:hypothetical protein CHP56_18960 [Salmonella enterica]|nr:hypothetical protein [Salmonella enterica]
MIFCRLAHQGRETARPVPLPVLFCLSSAKAYIFQTAVLQQHVQQFQLWPIDVQIHIFLLSQ